MHQQIQQRKYCRSEIISDYLKVRRTKRVNVMFKSSYHVHVLMSVKVIAVIALSYR